MGCSFSTPLSDYTFGEAGIPGTRHTGCSAACRGAVKGRRGAERHSASLPFDSVAGAWHSARSDQQ